MKKNQRYYSSGRSRKTSRYKRIGLLAGVASAVVISALCGRALDQRYRLASAAASAVNSEGRASLSLPLLGGLSREAQLRGRIEKLSGVAGKELLSTERWQASDPIVVDGVDVSDMFTQQFTLRRSLQPGYRVASVVVDAALARADSFIDLGLGANSNGGVVLRFSKGSVESFLRSHSGRLVPGEVVSGDSISSCERFELAVAKDQVQVSCAGGTVLSLSYPSVSNGRLFVASNLIGGELRELSIKGSVGDLITEDRA